MKIRKRFYYILILLLLAGLSTVIAQDGIGIKTSNPQATLDVNGNVIIREVPLNNASTKALM
ncbi:hypothetical protein ACG2LH_13290 [Zhouia sp. PK063]|uniref:hypothetical protein n=1 Tax=Zhouia sp. PK063 TaxID=3373602 RepID=UPI003787AF96